MKLSKTQQQLMAKIRETGDTIVRLPGGFWTCPDPMVDARGVPAWWFSSHTINALIKRNVLTVTKTGRTSVFPVECRLTEEGSNGHS